MLVQLRLALASAALCLTAVLAIAPAHAQDQATYQFDLPEQPLAEALRAIARQTGANVLFESKDLNGIKAPALRAQLTIAEAINRVLAGTKLQAERTTPTTIIVQPSTPLSALGERVPKAGEDSLLPREGEGPRRGDEGIAAAKKSRGWFRLAQNDQTSRTHSSSSSEQETSENSPENSRKRIELEEVVVTGSHIRGAVNNTAPVIVLDKAYIDSTGMSTTTGLIESLPQNFALANQAGVMVPGVSSGMTQGSSINLRGIGEGTTLVLLNGRRMASGFAGSAVDISALPLSAIERVEILTDGASALYGSDAVGGVVNFILRDDFEGAETRLRSGWADGGVNEHRVSQAAGNAWDSGNALASLEYYKRDLLPASKRDFVPDTSVIGSLFPRDKNYSAMLSGRQGLTEALSMFADALYTNRDSYNRGGRTTLNEAAAVSNSQITATSGLNWQAGRDWQIEASATYAKNELDQIQNSSLFVALGRGAFLGDSRFEIQTAQLKADGSVFELPGGRVRVAVGADWRSESMQHLSHFTSGFISSRGDPDQIVRSAFGEMHVPIVGAANARTGVSRLELSLAGRFDDYSSFGSSFDPRVGFLWEPIGGLRFRGSHGTSYKAPRLADYNLGFNAALAGTIADPGSSSGVSHQLLLQGTDVGGFSAQESESSSFGLEFTPGSIQDLQLALNYYRIEYTDRIAAPPASAVILGNPSAFGSLFIRNPSVAQVNEFIAIGRLGQGFFPFNPDFTPNPAFDPSTVDVIVDTRRRNLSAVKTSGLDVSMQYAFNAAGGDVQLELAGTYISELVQQITSASDPYDTVATFYNPPDWRVRGSLGWRRGGWAANLFVNHTDSYTDNRMTTFVPVSSHTTVDMRLAHDFGERFHSGFLSGVTLSVNALNLFDQDPPHTAIVNETSDMGFDPTNANPMGRFVAVELVKAW